MVTRVQVQKSCTHMGKLPVDKFKGKYIVGTWQNGVFSCAGDPMVQFDKTTAALECERLAKSAPGVNFVLMKIEGVVSVGTTVWR